MRITKRTDHFRPPLIALHQKLSTLTLVIVCVIIQAEQQQQMPRIKLPDVS